MDNHRASKSLTLGEIIEDLLTKREACWEIGEDYRRGAVSTKGTRGELFTTPTKSKPPQTGTVAKNGKIPCKAWAQGKCSDPCPKDGFHGCAALLTTGQLCGRKSHRSAEECDHPSRLS